MAYQFLRKAEAKVNKKVTASSKDAWDLLRSTPGPQPREWRTSSAGVVLSRHQQVEVANLQLYLRDADPIRVTTRSGFVQAKSAWSRCSEEAVADSCRRRAGTSSVGLRRPAHPAKTSTAPVQVLHKTKKVHDGS